MAVVAVELDPPGGGGLWWAVRAVGRVFEFLVVAALFAVFVGGLFVVCALGFWVARSNAEVAARSLPGSRAEWAAAPRSAPVTLTPSDFRADLLGPAGTRQAVACRVDAPVAAYRVGVPVSAAVVFEIADDASGVTCYPAAGGPGMLLVFDPGVVVPGFPVAAPQATAAPTLPSATPPTTSVSTLP